MSHSGVSMAPGETTLTRMGARSLASARPRPSTAALTAAAWVELGPVRTHTAAREVAMGER